MTSYESPINEKIYSNSSGSHAPARELRLPAEELPILLEGGVTFYDSSKHLPPSTVSHHKSA